jgi:hypothetical protein
MTRKDYVLIAETINALASEKYANMHIVASALADALAGDNPNFDRERFITACGVK